MFRSLQVWVRRIYIKLRNFYLYMVSSEDVDDVGDVLDMPVRPIQKPKAYSLAGKSKKSTRTVVIPARVAPEKANNHSTVKKKYN